jgi:hypothetical protein
MMMMMRWRSLSGVYSPHCQPGNYGMFGKAYLTMKLSRLVLVVTMPRK